MARCSSEEEGLRTFCELCDVKRWRAIAPPRACRHNLSSCWESKSVASR